MSTDSVYTLIYKSSVLYRTPGNPSRVRVRRGETLTEQEFNRMPESLRRHFVRGHVQEVQVKKLLEGTKGLIAGESKASTQTDVNPATGQPFEDETPEETGPALPTETQFRKMRVDDLETWVAAQDWLPAGTYDPEETKKANVAAITLAFEVYTRPQEDPDEVKADVEANGPAGTFEQVEG